MNPDEPSKITFESNQWQPPISSVQSQTPKIVQWVIKYSGGYVKGEKQATYVLIGFSMVAIMVSLFLFFGGEGTENTFEPSADAPSSQVIPPAEF